MVPGLFWRIFDTVMAESECEFSPTITPPLHTAQAAPVKNGMLADDGPPAPTDSAWEATTRELPDSADDQWAVGSFSGASVPRFQRWGRHPSFSRAALTKTHRGDGQEVVFFFGALCAFHGWMSVLAGPRGLQWRRGFSGWAGECDLMGKEMDGSRDVALRRGLCPFPNARLESGCRRLSRKTGAPSDLACGGKSWEFLHGEREVLAVPVDDILPTLGSRLGFQNAGIEATASVVCCVMLTGFHVTSECSVQGFPFILP